MAPGGFQDGRQYAAILRGGEAASYPADPGHRHAPLAQLVSSAAARRSSQPAQLTRPE
jgi:hypothetical protein